MSELYTKLERRAESTGPARSSLENLMRRYGTKTCLGDGKWPLVVLLEGPAKRERWVHSGSGLYELSKPEAEE